MSCRHSRDIAHGDIKPANVLSSNSHYKSYKHKELEITFGKKPFCKLSDLREARSIYTQTNSFTGKNRTITVHRGSLAFMTPELTIQELSIASAGTNELKLVDVWAVLMTFCTILNPDQPYPCQSDLKNVPNKATSNMEVAFKQELQRQAYSFFSPKYFSVQATF